MYLLLYEVGIFFARFYTGKRHVLPKEENQGEYQRYF
jgi:Sec-independent protein secretion pathway component TatC